MSYQVKEIRRARIIIIRIYLLILSLWIFSFLRAQDIATMQHKILTAEDGLPSEYYFSVFQDSKGFLWMTTGESVLVKYNGHNFERINYDPGDTADHGHYTNIMAMHEDREGVIWIGMLNGFFKYDPKVSQTTIKNYAFPTAGGYFPKGVMDIVEDDNENLWLATAENNLQVFNKMTETFTVKKLLPKNKADLASEGSNLKDLFIDRDNKIWLCSANGLFCYERNTDSFTQYMPFPGENNGANNMWSIVQGDTNTLWIGTYMGLYLFNTKSKKFQLKFIEENKPPYIKHQFIIHALTRDNSGNVWFRSRKALYKINKDSGEYFFKKEFEYHVSEIMSSTFSLIFDDFGNIIMPDNPQRIHIFSPENKNYEILLPEAQSYADANNFSSCILEDKEGMLWMGTSGNGLFRIDPVTKKMDNFKYIPGNEESLCSDKIFCIYEDHQGVLWIGTDNGVSKCIKKSDGSVTFKQYPPGTHNPASLKGREVMLIFEDELHDLWFLNFDAIGDSWLSPTSYYLSKYDHKENGFVHLKVEADVVNEVPDQTKKNEIWIPRVDGIFRIIPPIKRFDKHTLSAEKIILYQHGRDDSENMVSDFINPCPILHFQEDTFWFGGYYGLGRLILKPDELKSENQINYTFYNRDDGIEDNIVIGLVNDLSGNIWLAGKSNTLTRFNPATELSTIIPFSKPLKRDFEGTRLFKNDNGEIYYTSLGGVFKVNPESAFLQDKSYPLYITNLRISGKTVTSGKNSVLKDHISTTHAIQLRYNQNDLELEFALLDYRNPSKIQYLYQLEGLQEDWISSGNDPHARFFQVPPGKYSFRVKAADSEGIWNTKGVSVDIRITPPWWETLVAKILYVILPLILIGVYIRLRTQRLKKEQIRLEGLVDERTSELQDANEELSLQKEIIGEANEELKVQNQRILEMDEMKTRFFTNISHEFRTPISLITSPVEEMLLHEKLNEKLRDNLEMIHRSGIRMLNLVNQLLDISKIDAGKLMIELSESDVLKELRILSRGFTPLAERKRISYKIGIPDGHYITFFDYDKLYKISTNLLNNAFKFTPEKGTVSFEVQLKEQTGKENASFLSLTIYNSGEGIPHEKIDRIFDRFYQVSDPNREITGGTGIGLSLVKELVRMQHGTISVKSESGKGVSFIVEIPLGKDHLNPDEYELITSDETSDARLLSKARLMENHSGSIAEGGNGLADSDKPLVLIVEDNEDVLRHISEHLQKHFSLKHAGDGNRGWELADTFVPDLIITDRMMPGMNGRDLCAKLKNSESTNHIPVIMLTAKVESKDKIEGLDTGADDYITKPFSMSELIARSKNLIKQRKKLQEIYKSRLDVEPARVQVDSADERFLKKAMELININLSDSEFDVNRFYQEMHMSRMQLFRKLKALINQTPSELIRTMRLKRSAQLIRQKYGNIAEIAFEVGFNNLSYFAKCFREHYGVLPSEYK